MRWRVRPRCWNIVPSASGTRRGVALELALCAWSSTPSALAALRRHLPFGMEFIHRVLQTSVYSSTAQLHCLAPSSHAPPLQLPVQAWSIVSSWRMTALSPSLRGESLRAYSLLLSPPFPWPPPLLIEPIAHCAVAPRS